jgi:hypothetical protein
LRVVPAQDADERARLADVDLFVQWWCVYELGLAMRGVVDFDSVGLDILCWMSEVSRLNRSDLSHWKHLPKIRLTG